MKRMAIGVALCAALGGLGPAVGGVIGPGLDHLKTQPGSVWDCASGGPYFGPGSDPFDGRIAVLTDTKVLRLVGSDFTENPDVIPVEIVALSLHSVEPIVAAGKTYDVHVTLNPDRPSTGAYVVTHNAPGLPEGGEIGGKDGDYDIPPIPPESFFDVSFDFEFRNRFDDTDIVHWVGEDRVTLTATVPWSISAPPPYAHDHSGGFYPGLDPAGPVPPEPQTMVFQGEHFTWHLRLAPIPEPTTLGLLGLGALALLRRRRH
jgi:hypothetical protein